MRCKNHQPRGSRDGDLAGKGAVVCTGGAVSGVKPMYRELIWDRAEHDVAYNPDRYVVTGHTPVQGIGGNPRRRGTYYECGISL